MQVRVGEIDDTKRAINFQLIARFQQMLKGSKTMKKYIWAFDISLSRTGVSIFSEDGKFIDVFSIDTTKIDSLGGKLKFIGDTILKFKEKYPAKKIVIEQGFTKYNISTQAIFRVNGLVNYLFWDVENVYYAATTIKKCITGRGNAKKEEVREMILKNYPSVRFDNLDQSDSFSVGLCFLKKNGLE